MMVQRFNENVPKTAKKKRTFTFLDKTQLVKLKLKAVRSNVWLKALQRIDKVLINLAIKVSNNIYSVKLAKNIPTLARELEA
jgi:hypothetical protein